MKLLSILLSILVLCSCAAGTSRSASAILSEPVAATIRPVGHEELAARMRVAAEVPHAQLIEFGESVEGRGLLAIEFAGRAAPEEQQWRVFFAGLQHGNEHAGKDALLILAERLAATPGALGRGDRILIAPMINPDGGDRDERRNANDFDLNRDHLILSQPETRALHALARAFEPHVFVDCHEFTRDSSSYTRLGHGEWPLIMMDAANNAIMPDALYETALDWVHAAEAPMNEAGHNYCRYHVGGPPPFEEIRPSTLEPDDARNGVGMLGAVSFIIESGVMRSAEDPQADLHERVDAYLLLLSRFLEPGELREQTRDVVRAYRTAPLPDSIPANVFWASDDPEAGEWPVIDLSSGRTKVVPAWNLMQTRTIKRRVPLPEAYVIPPAFAEEFARLLEAHGIEYERLAESREAIIQSVVLKRLEENYDSVYERYDGRQIVTAAEPVRQRIPNGSLWVNVDAQQGRRAAMVLEPRRLYGLYEWPDWRATIGAAGEMPVWRIPQPEAR